MRPPTARLSPDSLALLEEAVEQVHPAYETQGDALRSGAYGQERSYASATLLGTPATSGVQESEALRGTTVNGPFVIQIAAYRSSEDASAAAVQAGRLFPSAFLIIERSGEYFRVALAGWTDESSALQNLSIIRGSYPDAWVRMRQALP
ncbi:MAG TPA: SPOR domain-containing protein [Longimicrobiaceae bacterium]|nr:SPOR domain-containing protein [Longimicrobiaceae bacterium]